MFDSSAEEFSQPLNTTAFCHCLLMFSQRIWQFLKTTLRALATTNEWGTALIPHSVSLVKLSVSVICSSPSGTKSQSENLMFETLMFLSPPITFVLFPLKKQFEKDMSFTCELPSPFPHDVLSVYIATGFWQLKTEFENLIFSMATPLRRLYVLSMHIPVLVLLTITFVIAQFLIIPLPTPILNALQRLVESMQLDIVMFSQTLSFFLESFALASYGDAVVFGVYYAVGNADVGAGVDVEAVVVVSAVVVSDNHI